jgi:sulfite exporter TauE/SafE
MYHASRLVAYATLGAVGGLVGAGLDLAGTAVGLRHVAAAVAGATMLVWGATMLFDASGFGPRLALPGALGRAVARGLGRLQSKPPVVRSALLGLGSALLPCGWLYAFVLVAAGTGSAASGAAAMAAFWLGTVPALLGVSAGARLLARRLGRRLRTVGAAALVLVGVSTVVTRMGMSAEPSPPPTSHGALPTEPPCHGHGH